MNEHISCLILPNEQMGGLYVGSLIGAKQKKTLKAKGINTVFTVAAMCNLTYSTTDQINHFVYNAMDSPFYNFLPQFDKIVDKI